MGNEYKKISVDYYYKGNWQIVIYGHSLDSTDADSLRWLMGHGEKSDIASNKVKIYYLDENSYNRQIANAIQIIGEENLIESVHSGKLIFLPINK